MLLLLDQLCFIAVRSYKNAGLMSCNHVGDRAFIRSALLASLFSGSGAVRQALLDVPGKTTALVMQCLQYSAFSRGMTHAP